MRAQYDAMVPYGRGLEPTNNFPIQRVEDVEPKELYYAQMADDARVQFWRDRWNEFRRLRLMDLGVFESPSLPISHCKT
jgi:hypothetical protein